LPANAENKALLGFVFEDFSTVTTIQFAIYIVYDISIRNMITLKTSGEITFPATRTMNSSPKIGVENCAEPVKDECGHGDH
jgi:hypothetical protein